MSIQKPPEGIVFPADADEIGLSNGISDDWVAAVHEAGHAVIAITVGYELQDVQINGAYRCRIELTFGAWTPGTELLTRSDEEDIADALYTLAGGKAELELPSINEERLAVSDREHFNTLGPIRASAEALAGWRLEMEREAEVRVRSNWSQIKAVARQLVLKRRLMPAEVQQLLMCSTLDRPPASRA